MPEVKRLVTKNEFDRLPMDNSLPHLESDEQLAAALSQIRAELRPGGALMASIRDYDSCLEQKPVVQGPSFYASERHRRVIFQVWDWLDDLRYLFHLYITRETAVEWETVHVATVYRAIRRSELTTALNENFKNVRWLFPAESGFYQPIALAEAA
jgi:glycine/sarcosine N-methyltransferase